jgi:hypothetical protein
VDKKSATEMLEQVARNLVATGNLSKVLGDLVKVDDRKLYTPMLKEMLSSNFELQSQIAALYSDLDPFFLGHETFALVRQKYEDPNYPESMPTHEEIEKSKKLWEKVQRMTKK